MAMIDVTVTRANNQPDGRGFLGVMRLCIWEYYP